MAICRELQDDHLIWMVLSNMGYFAFAQKNYLQARGYFKEALEIALKLKNKRTTAEILLSFAKILCAETRYKESARLHGFIEALFQESESLTESYLTEIKRAIDLLKMYLHEDSYQEEFDAGKSLQLEQAVSIALNSGRQISNGLSDLVDRQFS
jgi:hypothetical protein